MVARSASMLTILGVAREDLHRRCHDIAGRVFLRSIDLRQLRGVVLNALVARRHAGGHHRAEHLGQRQRTRRRLAQIEAHLGRQLHQHPLQLAAARLAGKTVVEARELVDPALPLLLLQRHLLLDQPVGHGHLVLVQKVRQRAVSLHPVTDDRRRPAVARPEAEPLERRIHAVVLRRIDARDFPVERGEHRLQLGHGENHPVRHVELAVVAIDHDAQIVEVLLAGEHHGFPDRPLLELAIAAHHVAVEPRRHASGNREALRDRQALAHRPGRDLDSGEDRPGMAVQDAAVRPRVRQHRTVEVAELGVDRRERGDRVPLAEHEQILSAPRRIGDVDVDEPAVEQRDERDRRRKRAARVQALVDGITALLERQQPDVGVLDSQQLEDRLTQQIVGRSGGRSDTRPPFQDGGL